MFQLSQPEGPNTITLDLDSVEGLYEICVDAVKKTNEHLKWTLYKILVANYVHEKHLEYEEEKEEDKEEDEDEESSEDGSNDAGVI